MGESASSDIRLRSNVNCGMVRGTCPHEVEQPRQRRNQRTLSNLSWRSRWIDSPVRFRRCGMSWTRLGRRSPGPCDTPSRGGRVSYSTRPRQRGRNQSCEIPQGMLLHRHHSMNPAPSRRRGSCSDRDMPQSITPFPSPQTPCPRNNFSTTKPSRSSI